MRASAWFLASVFSLFAFVSVANADFTPVTSLGTAEWKDVSLSSNGQYVIASKYGGYLYRSADYGQTWTEITAMGTQTWQDVEVSDDGSKMFAIIYAEFGTTNVWRSTDYGVNWSTVASLGGVYDLACDADCSVVTIGLDYGATGFYVSRNGGDTDTWSQQFSGQMTCKGIAMSDDGNTVICFYNSKVGRAVYSGSWTLYEGASIGTDFNTIYGVGTNSDATKSLFGFNSENAWRVVSGTSNQLSFGAGLYGHLAKLSGDGSKMMIGVSSTSKIWYSSDSGANWTDVTPAGMAGWPRGLDVSKDGTARAFANSASGYLYIDIPIGPTPETPTFYADGMECETVGIPDIANAEFNDFWGASITSPAYIVTQTFENGCVSKTTYGTGANGAEDAFAWQCYGSGTDIPQGAVTFPGTENAKFLFNYNLDTDTQFFEIASNRNFGPYPANVYIFSGATNAPNSAWGRFNIFTTNNNRYGGVVYASGGVATLLLADGEYSMNLRISTAQSFKGFLMGKAPIVNKVQCSVPEKNNFCNWDIQGLDFGCYPRISGGFENGICAVDDKGRCSPKVSTGGTVEVGPPLPGQIEVFDGSGNVSYTYDAGGKIKGSRLQADSIFDCSEYPDGFTGWLPCARKVARNIVSLISDSVNSVNGKSESGISKPLTEVGGYTGSISFSGVDTNGYNGIDTIVRKSWNEAYGEGSGTNLMRFAKIVSVGAFFLLFIFITILMANANRGGKSGGNT